MLWTRLNNYTIGSLVGSIGNIASERNSGGSSLAFGIWHLEKIFYINIPITKLTKIMVYFRFTVVEG